MSNYPFQSIKLVIAPWTGNTKKLGKILWILETVCTAFDYAASKHLLSGTYSCWILGVPEEEEVLLQPCPPGAVTQQLQHYSKCLWQMEMSYGLSEECQQENHSPDPGGFGANHILCCHLCFGKWFLVWYWILAESECLTTGIKRPWN